MEEDIGLKPDDVVFEVELAVLLFVGRIDAVGVAEELALKPVPFNAVPFDGVG